MRTTIRLTLLALVVFLGFLPDAQAGDKVVIGVSPSLTATLNIIAKQQGYFTEQNIDADIRVIESGPKAVAMMLNDEIDISESAIFALVSNSFKRKDFKIYMQASISGNDNRIVARKDKGIKTIADLKGKKIGVLKGGFPQYVLSLMLGKAGVDQSKIQLVYEDNEKLYQKLLSGELDAVCFYGGWVDKAENALKNNAILFHDEKLVRVTVVDAGKTKTFESKPDLYKRLIKAYIKAEDYVKKNPDAALKAVIQYLKIDAAHAQKVWKPKMIHVALEQSMLKDMENMAQWQIDTGIQTGKKIPNYLDYINFKSLTEVDAKRVTIAH